MTEIPERPSPQDGVFIYVFSRRAQVARYQDVGGGAVTVRAASNWEELEDEAVEVVEAQGGALTVTGYYRCDANLAGRAIWES